MNLLCFDYGLLFTFKICVEAKSFSKASEILHVKQPAISYSIRKLENILNVKLFDRGTYGINLTDEGKILYEYVTEANNKIISGLNVLDEFNNKEITELKIGVSLNLALTYFSKTLKEFREFFPNVKVSIISKREEEMLNDLKEKKLDIVIFNSSKNNSVPSIEIRKLKNTEIVCVGVEKYKNMIESKDKDNNIIIPIITPDNTTNLGKHLTSKIELKNIKCKEYFTCHSAIIAKELILSGLCIGYINKEAIKKELLEGKLFLLPFEPSIDIYSINVATQDKHLNIVIKQFIKIFKKKVNEEYENIRL